ncbi:hypothetical protein ACFL43_00090 [Thermodesulfobacteriota bacterium]
MTTIEYQLKKMPDERAQQFIADMLSHSYRIDRLVFADNCMQVDVADAVSDAEFADQLTQLLFIAKNLDVDVQYEQRRDRVCCENPQPYLEQRRTVQKIADGMYLLQGPFLKAFHALNRYVKDVADRYNAVEQEYPTLWPLDLYKKINYFKEFPQQVIMCAALHDDYETLKNFSNRYDQSCTYDRVALADGFNDSVFGLESAVCDCCYYALQDQADFSNTVYTCYNKVFRNEGHTGEGMKRLTNFSVRDIMFVGDETFVLSMRQKMIDEAIELVKYLDLDCSIETANDPFFANESILKNTFQYASKLKYEVLARLPYDDSRLAVGSVNLHLDFFGRAFNIRLTDGSFAHSGCLGFGFERLVFALYCQYGHDESAWPDGLKERLGLG